MSTPFKGFCGPSYQLENRYASIERIVNWFNEVNESGDESKFQIDMIPAPGNAPFSTLPVPAPFNQPARGILELRGGVYGVNGTIFYGLSAAGIYSNLGTVVNDGQPVSMVANGNGQIFIASAGFGYVYDTSALAFTAIATSADAFLGASFATFQDGYIIVVTPNSNQIQISGTDDTPLGDATKWDAANISVQAGQADKLRAVISSREYLRLLGQRRSQIYADVGNQGIGAFPFQSYNETFIETGIAAPFSLADLGDSLVWIGEDFRGMRACWRDSAFQPQRISNFAVEQFWQGYATVADAVAFPFIWKGHLLYQITFPTARATWLYDATVSALLRQPIWYERQFTNALNYQVARSERFHCYAYGRHLVASVGVDGNPGAVYQYSETAYADCGVDANGAQSQRPIVRDRICPHLWMGNKRIIYNRIEFELARGVGLDGGVFGADPKLLLRWSNDAGNTFGKEHPISVGKIGQFSKRVYLNRAGYARDRVFWIRATDPVYWGFVGAELDLIECAS